jgi:hypothetical protein
VMDVAGPVGDEPDPRHARRSEGRIMQGDLAVQCVFLPGCGF